MHAAAAVAGLFLLMTQSSDLSTVSANFSRAEKQFDLGLARTVVETQRQFIDDSTPMPERQVYTSALLLRAELALMQMDWTPALEDTERAALMSEAEEAVQDALLQLGRLLETPEVMRMRADAILLARQLTPDAEPPLAEAERLAREALTRDAANPRAHLSLARTAVQAEPPRIEEAMQQVDKALELNPGLERASLLRASLLAKAGRGEEAVEIWKQLIANNPEAKPAAAALQQWESAPAPDPASEAPAADSNAD